MYSGVLTKPLTDLGVAEVKNKQMVSGEQCLMEKNSLPQNERVEWC